MTYTLIAMVVFFVYATFIFMYMHFTENNDTVDLVFGLFACFVGAALWILTIPAIVLLGGAWLTSRVIIMLLKKR